MKHILTLIALAVSIFAGHAAEAVAQVAKLHEKDQLFHSGEWQIDAGYAGRFSGWSTVQDGAAFGVNHFPLLNFGLGAEAQVIEFGHTELDRIGLSLIARAPMEKLRLAPEARFGFLYDLERGGEYGETLKSRRGRGYDVFAGAGAEFRFTKNLGIGAEVRWVFQTEDMDKDHKLGLLRFRVSF